MSRLLLENASRFALICLATSKDSLLKKYPDLKEAIETFVQQDPTGGTLKYAEWEIKVLKSRQALSQEIADVVALFHRFRDKLDKKDLYAYQPAEFTGLRDKLFAARDEQAGKKVERQKKVEKRYQNEPEQIACGSKVVYDSPMFRCLQITNKAASMHYGLGTKWCITMKDQSYFEDYDKSNVVFFFILNKMLPKQNRMHKIALAYQRDTNNKVIQLDIFDALDEMISFDELVGAFFSALRSTGITLHYNSLEPDNDLNKLEAELTQMKSITEGIAKTYPKSLLAKIYSNELSIEEVFELFKKENNPQLKEAIAQWTIQESRSMTTSSGRGKAYSFDDTMQLLDKSGDMETVKELAASSKGSLFTKLTASHDIKERYEHLMPAVIAGTNFREVGHQALWQRMQTFHTLNSKDIAAIYFKYELPVEEIVNLLRCDNTPTNMLIDAYKNYHATESICRALAENHNTPTDIIDKLALKDDNHTIYCY